MTIYKLLDIFFLCLHSIIILFNLFGWIWKKTRKANLTLLLLTGLSWFVLGIRYGIGYCPFTDWHWTVLRQLGNYDLPNSYVSYLVQRITSLTPNEEYIDVLVAISYFAALIVSLITNWRDFNKKQ